MVTRIALAVLASAALVAIAAAALRVLARAEDLDRGALTAEDRFASLPSGRSIRYQLLGEGKSGPTFVLLHGLGGTLDDWRHVAPALAADAPVLAYDRSGFSTPANGPRDAAALADELHEVLATLALPKPYVLVTHSIGSLTARVYADRYRDEAGGLALIDPLLPEEWERVSKESVGEDHRFFFEGIPAAAREAATGWPSLKRRLGRLLGRALPTVAEARHDAAIRKPSHWDGAAAEAKAVFDGYAAVRLADAADDAAKLPLGVLSAGAPDNADRRIVNALHLAFTKRAEKRVNAVVKGADHAGVILDPRYAPEAVRFAKAVRTLVQEAPSPVVTH